MRILFVTVAWPQEGGRNLYSDLLQEFVKNNHEVIVVHADERVKKSSFKFENEIKVLRFPTNKIQKAGKLKKALSLPLLGFKFKFYIHKYLSDYHFDLIIVTTPPVTLSGLVIHLKKRYETFVYLLLKDIWPHSSASLNVISNNGLVFRYFRWHEKRMYRSVDVIGCMSPKNVEYVLNNNNYLTPNRVEECPNTMTPTEMSTVNSWQTRLKYNIPLDATVFLFSGNLSIGHGLDFYINVIDELRNYGQAYFLIGGSGTHFNYLQLKIKEKRLNNVLLYQWLPKGEFEKVLMASDVGIILLSSDYKVPQFPSRLLAYLDASKPVLCAINKETDIGLIVEEANCGVSVLHGDKETMINKIKLLAENKALRRKMGKNSKKLLRAKYTSKESYNIIMEHFEKHVETISYV